MLPAKTLYVAACEEFVLGVRADKDARRRQDVVRRVAGYLGRAEQLSEKLAERRASLRFVKEPKMSSRGAS